jgi:hypothetical protein
MRILAILAMTLVGNSALAMEPAAMDVELTETSCSFMVSSGAGQSDFVDVPGLEVLHPEALQPQLDVQLDPGVSLDGVLCWRSSAELGPNDDWVVRTGVPLYIKKDGEDPDSPVLVLELTDVGYRARIISGPEFSPAQIVRTTTLIETFNKRRNSGA